MVEPEEHLYASTTPGLEPALEAECQALGWKAKGVLGGVELKGPPGIHQSANLRLRTASRVLLRLGVVDAESPERLGEALRAVSLSALLASPAAARVKATGRARALGAERAEEIARRVWGLAASSMEQAQLEVLLRLEGARCTVSVDTSGELLYRRGYRQEVSRAPLRESLAAGLLLLSGYTGQSPFVDPMCGSGTLAIEAAMMAARRSPGVNRPFAFQGWPSFQPEAWARLLAQARAEELSEPAVPVFASDIHAGSLGTARRNARRAGVAEHIRFERVDVASLEAPKVFPGGLVTNAPYGIRVGQGGAAQVAVAALAKSVERFHGWRIGVLLGSEADARVFHLAGSRSLPVTNGGLKCSLLVGSVD